MTAVLESLADGTSAVVAFLGEPGIGKTRMLSELGHLAKVRGFRVMEGRAAEFEDVMPFAMFADAFDDLIDDGSPILEQAAELLSSLAGALPRHGVPGPYASVVENQSYWTHRAMRSLLELLGSAVPVVLLLDDLHWADEASTTLLSTLVHRPPEAPVLLAFACRDGSLPRDLAVALGSAENLGAATRFELAPLTSEVVETALQNSFDDRTRAWLLQESGGNPFYLNELVSALANEETGIPPAVSNALANEVQGLEPPCRSLLYVGAIVGDPFDAFLAGEVTGLERDAMLRAVDELVARKLLSSSSSFEFRFRHPLVQRALYAMTPAGQRMRLHAMVAGALAARGASAAAQAVHLERCAAPGDAAAIATLTDAAAETFVRSPARSAHWLSAALRILPAGRAHDHKRGRVLAARADALMAGGCPLQATETFAQALPLDREDQAWRSALIARWASVEPNPEAARTIVERGLSELGPDDVVPTIQLDVSLSTGLALRGASITAHDLQTAHHHGSRAVTAARSLRETVLEAAAEAALALTSAQGGHVEAAELHDDAAAAVLEMASPYELVGVVDALIALSWTRSLTGKVRRALEGVRMTQRVIRDTGCGNWAPYLGISEMASLRALGRGAEMRRAIDPVTELARGASDPNQRYYGLLQAAWARMYLGNLDRAQLLAAEAVDLASGMAFAPCVRHLDRAVVGAVALEAGDAEKAHGLLLRELGGPGLDNLVALERPQACEHVARALLTSGDIAAAERWVTSATVEAGRLAVPVCEMHARLAEAQLALARDLPEEAVGAAQRACELAEGLGLAPDAAIALHHLGRALAAVGEVEQGIGTLAAAATAFEHCEFAPWRARNEALLQRLGRPVTRTRRRPHPSEGGVASLTARESEIAALVTGRLTNRQIARRLFLSEKTIETHLRNIFFKLGVSSRIAVAHEVERNRHTL